MSVQILKAAAKCALPVFIAAFALPAFGLDVTYTTTGSFSGCVQCVSSAPSDSVTFNQGLASATVTTVPYSATVVTFPPLIPTTDGDAVTFNITTTDSAIEKVSGTFTLTITQSSPFASPASATLKGTLSGFIADGASNASVKFASTSVTLGNVVYTLDNSKYTLPAAKGIAGSGTDTITMTIDTSNVTPEPTFMMLSGLGFAGLAFVAYRRRRKGLSAEV